MEKVHKIVVKLPLAIIGFGGFAVGMVNTNVPLAIIGLGMIYMGATL